MKEEFDPKDIRISLVDAGVMRRRIYGDSVEKVFGIPNQGQDWRLEISWGNNRITFNSNEALTAEQIINELRPKNGIPSQG